MKSNAIDTNYFTTFLQTADVANFYYFQYGPITNITFLLAITS